MKCDSSRKYDKKITVLRLSGTADSSGHIDGTTPSNWKPYTSSYASVMTKGGREFWKVQQVDATVDCVWRCPWSRDLAAATPDMRLQSEGVNYDILSVIDIDLAHQEVEIQSRRAVR